MADRFGAKNVFRAAIAVFVVGSVACAASNSLAAFVVSRFLQGMGGAMMTPVGRLVLIRSTPRSELVSAMAADDPRNGWPFGRATSGRLHHDFFSWHWIFLINVPIGLIGIWFATRFLPDNDERIVKPLDWPGFFLSGIAMSGVVFGLSVVSLPALPPVIGLVTVTVGLICSALYIFHARRTIDPLLNLKLFDNQVFRSAVLAVACFGLGLAPSRFCCRSCSSLASV